jgi:hypothetical protein
MVNWKIISFIFLFLFLASAGLATFFYFAWDTSYTAMYENACLADCRFYNYSDSYISRDNNCVCLEPYYSYMEPSVFISGN